MPPLPPFAGLDLDRPLIVGIVNVTPDSFYDGGKFIDPETAIAHGRMLAGAGAHILDIGGESARPGAATLGLDEELGRVMPVVAALVGEGHKVSIDTRKAAVMKEAIKAGAAIVNDITALGGDAGSMDAVAGSTACAILMHMRGDPGTMQNGPRYKDAPSEIRDYLEGRIKACQAAGIGKERIAVDPGIGFGKSPEHNLQILNRLDEFLDLGCAVVLGVSRKSFIGAVSESPTPDDRLGGSLAAALAGVGRGAHILRVHDVAQTKQAIDVWAAIEGAGRLKN